MSDEIGVGYVECPDCHTRLFNPTGTLVDFCASIVMTCPCGHELELLPIPD